MHGLADKDLSAQLAEELTYYEKEKDSISTSTEIIDNVNDYKENSSIITKPTNVSLHQFNWELVDKRTLNEVNLTREFNDEKIRILFKVTPVDFLGDESELLDAEEEEDEEEVEISEQSEESTATSSTYETSKSEELIDSSDDDFEEEPDPEKTLRCAITIDKKEKGVLAFEAFARE
ncbi:6032_t:CDS:2, partial [Funneliformis geosporum]